jgi:predicted cobalt transporter CbtA
MRLLRWFLIFGCIGILVAVILGTSSAIDNFISPAVRLVLWPSAFAGMANPSDLPEKFMVVAIVYGGNFVVYGVVGTAIGLFLGRVKKSN